LKWIGQHIVDLIARFRGETVYFESPATTANVIDISAPDLTTGSALSIDVDDALTTTNTKSLAKINYDKSGVIGALNTANITGLEIALNDDATNNGVGGSHLKGVDIKIDYDNATGAQRPVGVKIEVAKDGVVDALNGKGTGWETTVNDNGLDFKCYSSANDHVLNGDFSSWQTSTNGATTITTVDASHALAHFEIAADGDITLDANGDIKLEPKSGGSILLDGTIDIDAGVVTGATSITSTAFVGDLTGEADTVATIAGLAPNTATTQASQPNITTLAGVTALGAAGNPLTVTSDQVIFASAAASDPLVNIQNTANDASAPRLRFTKNRGGGAVDADNVGEISFWSYDDGTPSTQQYAFIKAQVHEATSDQESGLLQLGVASHDGDIHVGLSLVGGDEDGNINVNLGLGANSAINIPGNIDLAGDIDVDGTLETDALTIGGATIAAIGTTAITTLGTIGTGVWNGTAIASDQQKHLMHYNTTGYSNGSTEYQISEAMNVNPVGSVEHDTNIGSDGLTGQTVQTWLRSGGHVMPRACTLKRWSGWSTSPTTGDDPTYGLFKVTLEDDVDSDPSAELITEMTIVASGNPIANFYSITTASSGNADDLDIAAGDIVFFAIKGGGNWIYFNGTFEVEF
jgi:hypothetical protein